MSDLDDLLVRLATTSVDQPSLAAMESGVWERVDVLRNERFASQLRLGAVSMALVAGLTAGGLGAVAAPRPAGDLAIFSVDAALSPLLRLEAGR